MEVLFLSPYGRLYTAKMAEEGKAHWSGVRTTAHTVDLATLRPVLETPEYATSEVNDLIDKWGYYSGFSTQVGFLPSAPPDAEGDGLVIYQNGCTQYVHTEGEAPEGYFTKTTLLIQLLNETFGEDEWY